MRVGQHNDLPVTSKLYRTKNYITNSIIFYKVLIKKI